MRQTFGKSQVLIIYDAKPELERLSLTSFSSLVQCLQARPVAYPRVEHLKQLTGHKHPRLLCCHFNDEETNETLAPNLIFFASTGQDNRIL
jgi:hypothetical protein